MRFYLNLLILLLSSYFPACASTPKASEDPRLEVEAAASSRRREVTTNLLYTVRIRNVSERVLTIRRVEIEPIGGGKIRPAYVTASKLLEPSQLAEFQIWAELDPGESVMGIGDTLAKVIVSFDDDMQKVLATYLVNLQ